MKNKLMTKALVLLLALMMIAAMLPNVQHEAAAAGTPVLVINSNTAVNPILDHVLDFATYSKGGPFTVTFDWMCDTKLNDPTKGEYFSSVIVEGTVYGSTTQTQVYPGYRINGKTGWQTKSFQFQNVGTYNVSGSNLQGGILRFYMLYSKGEFKIRNLTIKNAAGTVLYNLNTDSVVAQAVANMQASGMTECDMGELAAIDYENCPWVAGQFSTGTYTASIMVDGASDNTTTTTITRPPTQGTTKAPTSTTKQPVSTTQAPVSTTKAPVSTSKQPVSTTKKPTTKPVTNPTTQQAPGNENPCINGHHFENGYCVYCAISDPNYNPCAYGHEFLDGYCVRCLAADPWYQAPTTQPTVTEPQAGGPSSTVIFIWISIVLIGMIVVVLAMLLGKKKKKSE